MAPALILIMACLILGSRAAAARSVGIFVQVEGEVEVLHHGRPPAVPVKVQDAVFRGDQVRTKAQSRAQVRFVDDTVLTISPGSAVLIEEYLFDEPQGFRQTALHLLRGLGYTVVNRILQTEKPDFLMKTQTAVFGVRGTRFFTLAGVTYSGHYLEEGLAEVSALTVPSVVALKSLEFATAEAGRPLVKGVLTPEHLNLLRQWLLQGVPAPVLTGPPPFLPALPGPRGSGLPEGKAPAELEKGLFVPPVVEPLRPVSPPAPQPPFSPSRPPYP